MRVFRQQYTDRQGRTRESEKWYVEVKDHRDKPFRTPGFTDKKQTVEFGRRLEKLVAVRANSDVLPTELSDWLEHLPGDIRSRLAERGLIDSRTAGNSKPLSEHVADFEADLGHRGNTEAHCRLVATRVRRLIDERGFVSSATFLQAVCRSAWARSRLVDSRPTATKADRSASRHATSTSPR